MRRCPSREPRWRRASPAARSSSSGASPPTAATRRAPTPTRSRGTPGAGYRTSPSRSTTPRRRARTAAFTSSAATAAIATRSRRPSCSGRTQPGGVSRRCPTPAPPRQLRSRAAGSTSSAASMAGAGLARVAFALDLKTQRWARIPRSGPARASGGRGGRHARLRRRWPQRRDRHEHDALRGLRRPHPRAGRGWPRSHRREAAPVRRSRTAASSRSAASARRGRSHRSTPTG